MAKNPDITKETEVSTSELACVLGVTARYVRQLAEDGVLSARLEFRWEALKKLCAKHPTLFVRKKGER